MESARGFLTKEECTAEELAGDRRIRETDLWNRLAGEKN